MKKFINPAILIISLALNVFGIMSLLQVAQICEISFLGFYNNIRLILRYVCVVIIMMAAIMSFNLFASRCKGKAQKILSIGVTTYSTILTVPLFLTFVLCLVMKCGVVFTGFLNDFVSPIYLELIDIFTTNSWQYVIFIGGIIMGIVFLAVPIIMCVNLLKKKPKKEINEFIRA